MRLLKENTAALLIDVQYKLFPFINNFEQLELNMARLMNGLSVLNIPLIVTEQYTKGLGATIQSLREVLVEKYVPMEKATFSCCDTPDIMRAIADLGKKNIIICGIEAHVCVQQTTIDLLERGFRPVVIEDCVSSRKESDQKTAIRRMRAEGAVITSYESILFELCRTSGTDEFRAISKIVK